MGENLLHQPGKYSRVLLELRVALSNKNQFDSWFLYYTSNNDAITFININMYKNPYVNLPCRVDRNAITRVNNNDKKKKDNKKNNNDNTLLQEY